MMYSSTSNFPHHHATTKASCSDSLRGLPAVAMTAQEPAIGKTIVCKPRQTCYLFFVVSFLD